MATRRKSWFRVADAILYEHMTNDDLACWIRLLAYLNTRWAREGRSPEESCRAVMGRADLALISGKHRRDVALKSVQRLAHLTATSVRVDGEFVEIIVRNFSDIQDFKSIKSPLERPEIAPSASSPASSPASASKGERESGATHPPAKTKIDPLWLEVNEAFRAYMPRSTGLTLTDARRRKLQSIVKGHGDDAPLAAIHGYAALHLTKPPDDGFDPLRNFNPETCWSGKMGKYIDADTAARDSGQERPYRRVDSSSQFEADRKPKTTAQIKQDAIHEAGRGALEILKREQAGKAPVRLVGGET